jgi:hypothetical protein
MLRTIALFLALAVLAAPIMSQIIVCDGRTCGGTGIVSCDGQLRDYVYRVTGGPTPAALDTVCIGTHDPDLSHYGSICLPTGWTYEIVPISRSDYSNPINHGVASPAADGNCPYTFQFLNVSGTPLSSSTATDFGFNYYGYPHVVDWRVAALPSAFANWASPVGTGAGPVHGPRCDTLCESGFPVPYHYLAGNKDNFDTNDGPEPSSPSPALLAYMQTISGGADPYFDSPQNNRCFGHSFTGFDVLGCVVSAQLCFRITAISEGNNDFINLRDDATTAVWGPLIKYLKAWARGNPADTFWTVGDTLEVCLDLANMPPMMRGTTYHWVPNLLATLQDGDLDFLLSDDTKIDYLELTVEVCSDTCYATGDINNDGTPLTITDLSALIAFVYSGVLPLGPLWQCDLNGDDHIDQLDIDRFLCYLQQGISCFPEYPVPTDCDPDTIRGSCCEGDSCTIKSELNCSLADGYYAGDGATCEQVSCVDMGACCWPDGSCTWELLPSLTCPPLGGIPIGKVPCTPNPCISIVGACCFPDGSCSMEYFADCQNMGGKYQGNGVPCNPNPCPAGCVDAPASMRGWWPLDETAPPRADDIVLDYDGLHISGIVGYGTGKIGGAYRIDWANQGVVRVPHDPFRDIGTGDFTVDAWIYPESHKGGCVPVPPATTPPCECWERMIVSNAVGMFCANCDKVGVQFSLMEDPANALCRLRLRMNESSMNKGMFESTPFPLVLNQWQHVAVTVSRSTGTGIFYLNGTPISLGSGQPTFVPVNGPMHNTLFPLTPFDIGHGHPDLAGGPKKFNRYFGGMIDEVEVFSRALDAVEIADIYDSQVWGKCRIYGHVPRMISFCPDDTEKKFTFTINNELGYAVDIIWGVQAPAGCPSGFWATSPNYLSPANFNPQSGGPITVSPGITQIQIKITIPSLASFPVGAVNCYQISFGVVGTNIVRTARGAVNRLDWNDCPQATLPHLDFLAPPIPLYLDSSVDIDYRILNTSHPTGRYSYEIRAYSSGACGDPDEDHTISFNDQPPGVPVTGTIDIPMGDSAMLTVTATLKAYEPFSFVDIIWRGSWDEDTLPGTGPWVIARPMTFADCNGNGIPDDVDIATATSPDANGNGFPDECELHGGSPTAGDANSDGQANIGDAVYLINFVFKSGPPPPWEANGDANGDCNVNVGDAVYMINFVFKGGTAPICNEGCVWK